MILLRIEIVLVHEQRRTDHHMNTLYIFMLIWQEYCAIITRLREWGAIKYYIASQNYINSHGKCRLTHC